MTQEQAVESEQERAINRELAELPKRRENALSGSEQHRERNMEKRRPSSCIAHYTRFDVTCTKGMDWKASKMGTSQFPQRSPRYGVAAGRRSRERRRKNEKGAGDSSRSMLYRPKWSTIRHTTRTRTSQRGTFLGQANAFLQAAL